MPAATLLGKITDVEFHESYADTMTVAQHKRAHNNIGAFKALRDPMIAVAEDEGTIKQLLADYLRRFLMYEEGCNYAVFRFQVAYSRVEEGLAFISFAGSRGWVRMTVDGKALFER